MCIKIRCDLSLINDLLTAVVFLYIIKCIRPFIDSLATIDSCSSHIDGFPTVGFGVPLISGHLNANTIRSSIVSIAFIIPVNCYSLIDQFNITGNDSAGCVASCLISTVQVFGCILVFIILSYLIIVRNCRGVLNSRAIKILLIILPSISPSIAVIGNCAICCTYTCETGIGVMKRLLLDLNTVCKQIKCYSARSLTIIIALILPLDRELDIVTSRDQVVIELDISGIACNIVVDGILVSRVNSVIILRSCRTLDFTGGGSSIMNITIVAVRIRVSKEHEFVGDLLGGCIRCCNRQIVEYDALLVGTIISYSFFSYQLILDRRNQSEFHAFWTATIIVGKVIPPDCTRKGRGLLIPDCIQIESPVAIFLRRNFWFGKFKFVAYWCLAARSLSPAAEEMTGGVLHCLHQMKKIIIAVSLSSYETGSFPSIIVVNLYFLCNPLCVVSRIGSNLRVSRQRSRACCICIPTFEIITFTRGGCTRLYGFVIFLSGCRLTATRIVAIPCKSVSFCFPNSIQRILVFRRFPVSIYRCGGFGCRTPSLEFISISIRIARELERQLNRVGLGFAILGFSSPRKGAGHTICTCYTGARKVIIEICNIHISLTLWLDRSSCHISIPLCVVYSICAIRYGYRRTDLVTALWGIIPTTELKCYITNC